MTQEAKKALNRGEQAGDEFAVVSNKKHELVVHPLRPPYEITIDLQVDPRDLKESDDKYTLFSTDENKTYSQTLTTADDKVEGDDQVTLTFTGLDPDLSYTLKVDPGFGDPEYDLFVEVSYADLKMAEEKAGYFDPDESEKPNEDEEETEVELSLEETDEDDIDDADVNGLYDEIIEEEGLKEV